MASRGRSQLQLMRPVIGLMVVGLAIAVIASIGGETAGPIVVIGGVAVMIFFSFRVAGRLNRGFSGQDVIERGKPTTAVITSMSQTGMRVNDQPMVEWTLEVAAPDGRTFTHVGQQVLPLLFLGQVRPGMSVPVAVVAEADGSMEVAIDFARLGSGEGASAGPRIDEGHLAGARLSGQVVDRDEFLSTAISATGEIDEMSETGRTGTHPGTGEIFDAYAFTVTVLRAGHEPYRAQLVQGVPADLVGRVGPGARVPIGIRPDDPSDVIIDWDAHRG